MTNEEILDETFSIEGGYSNRKHDGGGPTNLESLGEYSAPGAVTRVVSYQELRLRSKWRLCL